MSDEAFLARWSRLKRTTATAEPAPEAPLPETLPEETLPAAVEAEGEAVADPHKDLPSIADLTADSDFTPFLRAEVPEDLHRQALRKLWTSDPIYANDDGMKDYADDYTGLFNLSEPVKTLYRVGKGFLDDIPSPPQGEGQGEGVPPAEPIQAAVPPHPDPEGERENG